MQTPTSATSFAYTGADENAGTPPTQGKIWNVKNLLELKNAQRVLIDGNIFEHSWAASQKGYAILLTPRNQDGTAPWSAVRDITISNNIIRHVAGAIDILGEDYEQPSQHTTRIAIRNNVVFDVSDTWGGEHFLLITGSPSNVTVDHNTVYQDHMIVLVDDGACSGFVFTNNFARQNEFGIFGSGAGIGGALAAYFPGSVVQRNVDWRRGVLALSGRQLRLRTWGRSTPVRQRRRQVISIWCREVSTKVSRPTAPTSA